MSGCPFKVIDALKIPFAPSESVSNSDPLIFRSTRQYPRPYISPYHGCFSKFLDTSYPELSSLPFYLQNSLFHQDTIQGHRDSDCTQKVVIANELRESGNRNFSKSLFEKAVLCYEHALSLFIWVKLKREEGTAQVVERKEEDQLDETARQSTVCALLGNLGAALIKLRHFGFAEEVLFEAFKRSPGKSRIVLFRAYLRAYNKESDVQLLNLALGDLHRATEEIPEAACL